MRFTPQAPPACMRIAARGHRWGELSIDCCFCCLILPILMFFCCIFQVFCYILLTQRPYADLDCRCSCRLLPFSSCCCLILLILLPFSCLCCFILQILLPSCYLRCLTLQILLPFWCPCCFILQILLPLWCFCFPFAASATSFRIGGTRKINTRDILRTSLLISS